jgi:ADP-ribosylglycohydrolase
MERKDARAADLHMRRERALAMLRGQAIGDALALPVRNSNRMAVAERHPQGLALPYKGSYSGHASGDWTWVTDISVLTMRTLTAYYADATAAGAASSDSSDIPDPGIAYVKQLMAWQKRGFKELEDTVGTGLDAVTQRCLRRANVQLDPKAAAETGHGAETTAGALVRIIPCAVTPTPEAWAVYLSELTHNTPVCHAAAAIASELLSDLMQTPPGEVRSLIAERAIRSGIDYLNGDADARASFLLKLTDTSRLSAILGKSEHTDTLTALRCMIWALRRVSKTAAAERGPALYMKTLNAVAAYGGESSTNCALVGAVLGAALGPAGIPPAWLAALPNQTWLTNEIATFTMACARVATQDSNTAQAGSGGQTAASQASLDAGVDASSATASMAKTAATSAASAASATAAAAAGSTTRTTTRTTATSQARPRGQRAGALASIAENDTAPDDAVAF